MDAKVTLSFNQSTIENAKIYAKENNISLSRLVEFLLQQVTAGDYASLQDFPIADWVNTLSEGAVVYQTKPSSRKSLKSEYYSSKKK